MTRFKQCYKDLFAWFYVTFAVSYICYLNVWIVWMDYFTGVQSTEGTQWWHCVHCLSVCCVWFLVANHSFLSTEFLKNCCYVWQILLYINIYYHIPLVCNGRILGYSNLANYFVTCISFFKSKKQKKKKKNNDKIKKKKLE